jgi:hypothetical protein
MSHTCKLNVYGKTSPHEDIEETSVNFIDFSLMYASRSCNRVTHMLAKQVTDDIRLGEWHSAQLVLISC